MGKVFVKNIRLHAYHGVLQQERVIGNDYLVSVSVTCSLGNAVKSDTVDDTINYAAVYELVKEDFCSFVKVRKDKLCQKES